MPSRRIRRGLVGLWDDEGSVIEIQVSNSKNSPRLAGTPPLDSSKQLLILCYTRLGLRSESVVGLVGLRRGRTALRPRRKTQ